MTFGERLQAARKRKNMLQLELAKASGISVRSIQNWESGLRRPSNIESIEKLAAALGVSTSDLVDDNEAFLTQAGDKYGQRGIQDATQLLNDMRALFTNGEMKESDMDAFMKALQQTYWEVKEINSEKYNPNKNKNK